MRTIVIAVVLGLATTAPAVGQAACRPEGVWQLVSGTADGRAYPATQRQIKIITKSHFAVLSEEDRGGRFMITSADWLRAFRTMFSGGGRYTVEGTTYAELLDFVSDPAYQGLALPFTCRTEGDRFIRQVRSRSSRTVARCAICNSMRCGVALNDRAARWLSCHDNDTTSGELR